MIYLYMVVNEEGNVRYYKDICWGCEKNKIVF